MTTNVPNKEVPEFERLQKFSKEIIDLGKEIEARLKEKEKLEEEMIEKGRQARLLQMEVYQIREKLIKLDLELAKLEQRRRELQGM